MYINYLPQEINETIIPNLGTGLLIIQNNVLGKPITRALVDHVYDEFACLFDQYDMKDLQWFLSHDENTITFHTRRNIDKCAILGILSALTANS
jgi:hypothetical protein